MFKLSPALPLGYGQREPSCAELPRCLSRRVDVVWFEAFDSGAYGDVACCEDVDAEAAAGESVCGPRPCG
jgi:hypothetical protein